VGMLGGFTPVMIKFGVREFPPLLLTTLRFLVASIVFYPFFFRYQRNLARHDIWFLFTRSLFFAGNVGFFSVAIQYTTTIVSQLLYTLVPVIVLLMSRFLFKETMTMQKIAGLIIASFGVGLILKESIVKTEILAFGTPLGNLLTLIAVFSWAFYVLVSKDLTKKYSPVVTSFSSFVTTVVVLLFLLPFEGSVRSFQIYDVTTTGILSIFGLGIFSSALMFFLIQFVIKKTSPFTASLHQYIGPFSSGVISVPILGEKPTPILFVSGLCIIFGVLLATAYEHLRKQFKSVLQ
ncbi:MAG: EamA family transporter, partial [Candidatus Levybacteria bacterium]|nr:EamA family transporter [Candidatus Levybacteria bacterium]